MTPEEIRERVLDDVARIEYEDNIGKHGHSTPWTAAPEFVRASWRRRAGRLSGVIAKAVDAALKAQEPTGYPDPADLLGADPGWTGGKSVDEYMNEVRRG